MKLNWINIAGLLLAGAAMTSCGQKVTLDDSLLTVKVQADEVTAEMSPLFYGLMTEEINYSYDGGLYGELIRNRAFEAPKIFFRTGMPQPPRQAANAPKPIVKQGDSQGLDPLPSQLAMRQKMRENMQQQPGGPMMNPDAMRRQLNEPEADPNLKYVKGLYYWNAIADGNAKVAIAQDSIAQDWTVVKKNMRVEIKSADENNRAGVYNEGYWGIPVKPHTDYRASFYAKADDFNGSLTVSIESNDGQTTYATAQVDAIAKDWVKYELTLRTGDVEPTADARFSITSNTTGRFWLSFVSLFPPTWNDRPNGNRQDIMQLMADMHPRFLRFPGGNYLQGNDEASRFDWKKMIGPIEERPTHYNKAWGYHSSDGMGLLEFMYWCEDLGMEPILGVFAGFYLGSATPYVGEDLEPYIEDALNEIEYLTGDVNTEWGALRAKHGHPEPFKLKYVEIGNEDFLERYTDTYNERYEQMYKAIKAVYPELTLIASSRMVTSIKPDMVDVHQYMRVEQGALAEAHRYDNFDRSVPILIGEYATRDGSPTTNMRAGLYDAAYLLGLERNADIIKMTCFAPIFVNVNQGGMQWPSDLMGYDALNSYGSPSYYVQGMLSENLGEDLLASEIVNVPVNEETGFEDVYYNTTKDADYIYLKVVNVAGTAYPFQASIDGVKKILPTATVTTLKSESDMDTNSIDAPTNIVPTTSVEKGFGKQFAYTLPPYSVTIFKLAYK